ncbi:MAG: hypothetical protein ACFE8F_10575 [Promethearchaeota archaeon]
MEPVHLEDYIPFILVTALLLTGSLLVASQTPVLELTLNLLNFPVIHLPVIGSLFLLEGLILGGVWCFTFYQKIRTLETDGYYICPRCQAYCHPDSKWCEFCYQDLDYTFEQRARSLRRIFPHPKKVGICSICGESGHYYRKDRWFCFHHRNQGR